jgi:long-chain fatty acid transport protein
MPLTISLGTAYTGFDRWTIAVDVRYLDWANTRGFDQQGYNPNTFAVNGLGWRSTWAVSVGSQYELTDRLTLRSGWQYMQNPIPHGQTMFNVPSALIIQNWASLGAGYKLRSNVTANIAYSRGLEQQHDGPVVLPAGVVPNSVVRSKVSADMFTFGVTVSY